MKNDKPFRSQRSRPFARSASKSRHKKEDETVRLPGDARPRRVDKDKPARSEKFKARFKDEFKPRRFEDAKTKPFRRDDKKPAFRKGSGSSKPKAKSEAPQEQYHPTHEGAVLIWGLHAARAAWVNPKRRIHRLWLTEAGEKSFEAAQNEAKEELLKRPDAKRIERDALDRIAPPGSVHQGIVIEVAPLSEPTLHDVIGAETPPNLILMLDQVTDPHNVGAILRSAAAFGAGAVIMTERNAPITTGVMAKSASGAMEHTPIVHVVNLARTLDELREAGYWSVGLAEEGEKNLAETDLSGRTVLVLGNEGEGLRHLTRQKCDELARLPTGGPIGSLNVSNAAAVGLYEAAKQKNRFE